MDIDPNNLPQDAATLRCLVASLLEDRETQEHRIRQLQHMLEQLLRARYGPRRERVNENQLFLFAAEVAGADKSVPPSNDKPASDRPKRKGHGRQRLPKSLKRQRAVFDLAENERPCPHRQGELKRIGEEISGRLEYVPASLLVIEEACQKYVCGNGCTMVTAEKPMAPIEKGLPVPGLLAHVVVRKYGDHVPLHRQEAIFQRQGVTLSRKTMCDWTRRCAELVAPLFDSLKQQVLASKVMQTDDTPVNVLDPSLPKTRTGRMWTYVGDRNHPYTVYDYTPTRSRDGPDRFMTEFRGHLQADAYSGYDGLYRNRGRKITEFACCSCLVAVLQGTVFRLDAFDGSAGLHPAPVRHGAQGTDNGAGRQGPKIAAPGKVAANPCGRQGLFRAGAACCTAQEPGRRSDLVHIVELGGARPILRRRRPGNRQQQCRAKPARHLSGKKELDLPGKRRRWAEGSHPDQHRDDLQAPRR
jgi:transposase